YGLVVAEALSQGIPSIVTKRTALEEFTKENGCFGVDCPPDPKEVSDLILRIHKNDVKVGPFSEKIRTWEKVSEDYENVYKKFVLGGD
ncbi:MAG: glycosyltransferase, partial [Methanobacterium paludis]|nr:glycosyltransferase [Methanobacterium paludis]